MFITKIYKMLLCMVLLGVLLPKLAYAESQSEMYKNRGDAYCTQGQFDLAIANYTKAIELNPQYAKAYNNRGIAYTHRSINLAMADYNKAIELNPQYANAYYNRGLAKNPKDAIADYTKAIELNPQEKDYYLKRAEAYRSFGKLHLTMNDYNSVLKIDPNNQETITNKRSLLMNNGVYSYDDGRIQDTSYNPFTY